ncbi:DinB family protein [Hymenobacter cellulosilyticus]|uniref:DinB family protein n=1 Tax=Hymenobacter cellulosilyticus TaxID=2932248 RepID=A0A8T9Q3D1_9BACT|nr:DinB family protein [Hymenobacter cellulosilyticus]UOQ70310.1 DinB family protein [Hymenobacter cellulosilyticus]
MSPIEQRIVEVSTFWRSLSEEQLQQRPVPEKWSKKEILGHLIDSAQTNIRRVVVGQYQPGAHIVYEQNIWVQAADYQSYPSDELLQLWVLLNRHFARLAARVPADQLSALINWGRDKPEFVSLGLVIKDYLTHLDHHVGQLYQTGSV